MPAAFRERLWAMQGRACAVCQRRRWRPKACTPDRDPSKDGAASWRGLICPRCSQYLGHIRDDPETARRMARYLEDPPAQRLLMAWEGELV